MLKTEQLIHSQDTSTKRMDLHAFNNLTRKITYNLLIFFLKTKSLQPRLVFLSSCPWTSPFI